MNNKEFARYFKLLAQLAAVHGEVKYKVNAYENAARQIENYTDPIHQLSKKELQQIKGIGKAIAGKIVEIQQSGTIQVLENLLQQTPPGIMEMLELKGLGPKTIQRIWGELHIETLDELAKACRSHELSTLKGIGKKTEKKILKALEFRQKNRAKMRGAAGQLQATQWAEKWSNDGVKIAIAGQVRRKCPVVDEILFLVGDIEEEALQQQIREKLDMAEEEIRPHQRLGLKGLQCFPFAGALPVTFLITAPDYFAYHLFLLTGSRSHVTALQENYEVPEQVPTEKELYTTLNLPYIPPPYRETGEEVIQAKKGNFPDLVTQQDIKGIIHAHTTYSDGAQSIEEMANYCRQQGYEYLGISDHSQSAYYANGLSPEQLEQQRKAINTLNHTMEDFTVWAGVESDILREGQLDYDDEILAKLDFVIASIHSGFNMSKKEATERLIKAIENKHTHILGHPTGRLLLIREGYPVDHKKIIKACAQSNVAIEINANPKRLDLDWQWLPYAIEQEVMISINPDAHSYDGIHDVTYGVYTGQKGGLPKSLTLNHFSTEALQHYFSYKERPQFA